jgi:hypothetical protein
MRPYQLEYTCHLSNPGVGSSDFDNDGTDGHFVPFTQPQQPGLSCLKGTTVARRIATSVPKHYRKRGKGPPS